MGTSGSLAKETYAERGHTKRGASLAKERTEIPLKSKENEVDKYQKREKKDMPGVWIRQQDCASARAARDRRGGACGAWAQDLHLRDWHQGRSQAKDLQHPRSHGDHAPVRGGSLQRAARDVAAERGIWRSVVVSHGAAGQRQRGGDEAAGEPGAWRSESAGAEAPVDVLGDGERGGSRECGGAAERGAG